MDRMLSPVLMRERLRSLQAHDAESVLTWAVRSFPGKVALTVSFGGGGLVLAHLISRIDRSVPVLFLNTGFLFPETIALKDRFVADYGLNVLELTPATDPGPLYQTDPDRCCFIRKVLPLEAAMAGFEAWVSAVRQDQTRQRANIDLVQYEEFGGHDVVKVFPLAHWTRADVDRYLALHGVPHNPLQDQGFTSIGCWPCTRRTEPGESERAGRWSGTGKTECGLHTFSTRPA
jgi:phosphoadenosine phosphosulfate reductase